MSERDTYEVANQLGGYVGPGTEKHLAAFLIREANEASKLADRIDALERENAELRADRDAVAKALQNANCMVQGFAKAVTKMLAGEQVNSNEIMEWIKEASRLRDAKERKE